jgi:signal peptidase complex subunit 3
VVRDVCVEPSFVSMHNLYTRVSVLASHVGLVLFVLAVGSAVTAPFFKVTAHAEARASVVQGVRQHVEMGERVDVGFLLLDLDADLSSLFHWNTKHVFFHVVAHWAGPDGRRNEVVLWDTVLACATDAKLQLRGATLDYPLVDSGTNLRGANITLETRWNVVTITGLLPRASGSSTTFTLPQRYA